MALEEFGYYIDKKGHKFMFGDDISNESIKIEFNTSIKGNNTYTSFFYNNFYDDFHERRYANEDYVKVDTIIPYKSAMLLLYNLNDEIVELKIPEGIEYFINHSNVYVALDLPKSMKEVVIRKDFIDVSKYPDINFILT